MFKTVAISALLLFSPTISAHAQQVGHDHGADMSQHQGHSMPGAARTMPTQAGQTAFATIAEVIAILDADPNTDWSQVNIDALRHHLLDMDNVLMRTDVETHDIEGGAQFDVTGNAPEVIASVERMLGGHSTMLDRDERFSAAVTPIDGGARLTVTTSDSANAARLRALGFYGLLAEGMHHQRHHLAMARGSQMMH